MAWRNSCSRAAWSTIPRPGRSNRLTSFDYTTGSSKEYTEELRLTSSFHGPLNFSVGGFYSEITSPFNNGTNYYVESNALTGYALLNNAAGGAARSHRGGDRIDRNSTGRTGAGHNYYDSRTGGGYLKSYAGFGEVYFDVMHDLRSRWAPATPSTSSTTSPTRSC